MKNLTCIVCPLGCTLSVSECGGKFTVSGNNCKRGEEYAISECTLPKRVVTSTIVCENGNLVSVKTDRAIPKENVFDCMKIIKKFTANLPIKCGDVIIEDVFGSNIVATDNAAE